MSTKAGAPIDEAEEGTPVEEAKEGTPVEEAKEGTSVEEAKEDTFVEEANEGASAEEVTEAEVTEAGEQGSHQGGMPVQLPEGGGTMSTGTTDLVRDVPPAQEREASPERPPAHKLPPVGVMEAIGRHWFIFALITLLFAGAGVAYGLYRKPAYTAEARLTVARFAVPNADLSGFVLAAQGLTVAYGSAINADQVVSAVSHDLHVAPGTVRADLSATPLPESPVLRVLGASRDRATAVALANAGSTALIRYAATLNLANPDTGRLLTAYHDAATATARADARTKAAQAAFNRNRNPSNRNALVQANAALGTAQLQEQTLGGAFQASQQGQGSAAALELISRANSASSDRTSKLQIAGFAGLVLGLLVGAALALLRANRRTVRAAGA